MHNESKRQTFAKVEVETNGNGEGERDKSMMGRHAKQQRDLGFAGPAIRGKRVEVLRQIVTTERLLGYFD